MKRPITLLILLAVFVACVAGAPVWGNPLASERGGAWSEHDEEAAKTWSFSAFQEESKKTAFKIKSTIETCVRTVVTVVKAVANAVLTVVVCLGKMILRFAISLLIVLAQWVLGLLI